jgi:hypothetical protein
MQKNAEFRKYAREKRKIKIRYAVNTRTKKKNKNTLCRIFLHKKARKSREN